MPADILTPTQRYIRQTIFAPIGKTGQEQLARATIAIVGCGALGSALADQLARAGVGKLILIDRDFVELHNLQRQSLFTEEDVRLRTPKAIAARNRLTAVNSEISIQAVVADLDSGNARALLESATLIVDGTDNFETRYLVNDVALALGIPWIYGGVIGSYGMTMTIRPGVSPCLRCIFPEAPPPGSAPTCDTAGVIAPAVHTIASIEVAEALKLAVGAFEMVNPGLLTVDLWNLSFDQMPIGRPRPDCSACGQGIYDFLNRPVAARETVLCGQNAVQVRVHPPVSIDLVELAERLRPAGVVQQNRFLLRFTDNATQRELTIFPDGRAIVSGTTDGDEARRLYATYVGL